VVTEEEGSVSNFIILRDGCFLTDCMLKGLTYDYEIDFENVEGPELEFVNLSRSPVIDFQPGGIYSLDSWAPLTLKIRALRLNT
jgi:hypothetical protein